MPCLLSFHSALRKRGITEMRFQRGFCVEVMPQPTQDWVGSSMKGWGKLSQANAYGKDRGQRISLSVG